MKLLSSLRSFAFTLFHRSRVEGELDEEFRAHTQNCADDLERSGLPRAEAERRARIKFGGHERFKEECRETLGTHFLDTLLQDVRYGLRMLRKSPGFTAFAVLTLALGIGANTAMFSVVNAVLLKPLPFPRPELLIKLEERHAGWTDGSFAYANFSDIAARTRTLQQLAAYRSWLFTMSGDAEPENVDGYRVSADFFQVLGISPALGRTFSPEENEPGAGNVAVLSNGLWRRRFGSDPRIIGKVFKINGTSSRIVGVMPAGFVFPEDAAIWMPLSLDDTLRINRRAHLYTIIGRIKSDSTLEQARSEARALSAAIDSENKDVDPGWTAYPAPFRERLVASVKLPILVLFFAVGFVLLIACANVANLLLARAAARSREIGVRIALGAGRGRVLVQLLVESLLLALIGAVFGLVIASYGLRIIIQLSPGDIPRLQNTSLDGCVLAFTVLVTLATGVLFGLAPAFQAFKMDALESRRSSSSPAQMRFRNLLVVSEIALALVLLSGAGLLMNSFMRLLHVPLGFNPKNVLAMQLFLPQATESASDTQTVQTLGTILEQVRTAPSVKSASLVNSLPIAGGVTTDFEIAGRPKLKSGDEASASICVIDPAYLRTMQIPLQRGREFSESDSSAAPRVMLINQTMANTFWPGQDPMGSRVTMLDWGPPLTGEIVGVVGDVKLDGPQEPMGPVIYWPYPQFPSPFNYLVVRTTGDPFAAVASIKRQVRAVFPEQPLSKIRTMEQVLGESLAQRRFSLTLIGVFAGLSLLLAAVGIAGVMAFLVAQRTQEMGIRMALGAQPRDVLALVLAQGTRMIVLGVAVGLAGAFGLTRLVASMLYNVSPTDPQTFVSVALLLTFVALAACYLPARRAMRIDPIVALRYE